MMHEGEKIRSAANLASMSNAEIIHLKSSTETNEAGHQAGGEEAEGDLCTEVDPPCQPSRRPHCHRCPCDAYPVDVHGEAFCH